MRDNFGVVDRDEDGSNQGHAAQRGEPSSDAQRNCRHKHANRQHGS